MSALGLPVNILETQWNITRVLINVTNERSETITVFVPEDFAPLLSQQFN
jgi:hypothetical protein